MSEFKETGQANPVFNALVQASGKMVLIDKLLTKLKESGHKVITCFLSAMEYFTCQNDVYVHVYVCTYIGVDFFSNGSLLGYS